ncbi:uncharacterized protein BP01DRAFT_391112 [Aspergillus saccharolyticus JOP 1030-1]|uniref:Uncharacterized protein n=1 Tax=Aspergillus saccharolyticus JOP 1030-1 TaxID=1450539 RepID=A0A318ZHN8_9EURO|nr:hypothetical protein BP01DRAFT_391112 [Aspergillus saccharolyticus JOP 1030-1]PYH46287.1 hypothetical protein BP01DRAFT_391112 [Aspergillus saccharolyticus JOP 1030-1]
MLTPNPVKSPINDLYTRVSFFPFQGPSTPQIAFYRISVSIPVAFAISVSSSGVISCVFFLGVSLFTLPESGYNCFLFLLFVPKTI